MSTTAEWPRAVAGRLTSALSARPMLRLCLATGETTRPVYERTRVTGEPMIFLLDEFGGLPRHDPARCAAMLRRDLPGVPFLAPDVDGEDPEAAAGAYGRTIDDGGLDLAVVGLGGNGHLGMNEPGSSPLSETRVVDLARSTSAGALRYGATIEPLWGITVGLRQLMEARELWLVVSGRHKAKILRRVLGDQIGPDLPATFLREHHNARLLADAAAMGH